MTDGSPLTPEQRHELENAKERAGGFMGAAKVASFNGWTFGFFAVISILTGLSSFPVLLVGLGLAAVARNELVGRKRILAYDPSAFELLWKNQVGLMAIIIAYCVWAMLRTSSGPPDPAMEELVEVMGEGVDELVRALTMAVYAIVIGATAIFQGLNARYYYVRIERLREYVERTPAWVMDLQRSVS
jgi:hypothetical protein